MVVRRSHTETATIAAMHAPNASSARTIATPPLEEIEPGSFEVSAFDVSN
jgi:hypothetical protein